MSAVPKAVQKQAKRVERLEARIARIEALIEAGRGSDDLDAELEERNLEHAFLSKKVARALAAYE
jgi:hypothetical protein